MLNYSIRNTCNSINNQIDFFHTKYSLSLCLYVQLLCLYSEIDFYSGNKKILLYIVRYFTLKFTRYNRRMLEINVYDSTKI